MADAIKTTPTTIDDIDYEVGQDNITKKVGPIWFDIHNPVFIIAALGIIGFVAVTLLFPIGATALFEGLRGWLTSNFSWFFILAGNIFVLFGLMLVVTPLGNIRLGGPDAKPDYGYMGWFAMLFAAGMGIGLMFYGVSEPLSHYSAAVADGAGGPDSWAPIGGAAGNPEEAARLGLSAAIYHWALHPWGIYAVVALALALFSYNRGMPLAIRTAFYPIFGDRVWGWTGHIIDIIAVFATLFGLATSLGIGAEQAVAGFNFLFGTGSVEDGTRTVFGFEFGGGSGEAGNKGVTLKILFICAITAMATISVVTGLDRGVKRLSEANLVLATLLLLFVFFVGPTGDLISILFGSLADYVTNLPALANPFGREDTNFAQGWTAFYWAWWISWSPFVGMFIARVSRGRTVREFVVCVLLIPSLVCATWMAIFGGTAIQQVIADNFQGAADADLPVQLFEMLSQLPLAQITSLIGIVLVVVFFVTSSDSGSLVIDTITAGGKMNAPVPQRVFWCVFEGVVAIVLLAGGGLAALQAMAVATGFPFAILLLLMCVSIFIALVQERRAQR
ncbi:BCCT family transporter [Acuticoccus sp. I52.16.1]|uniref:BCCT family transporter n=1 Tax=Acuticoccus sp. I52.16.1 TaxID=2928472 RepID=UPI001FD294C1|nr:BCCT family transporter [Acuticoccus sp. I52.16.1]UOM36121.1 BCCT family transporter [Acuticoccus sp. I52.16.1]